MLVEHARPRPSAAGGDLLSRPPAGSGRRSWSSSAGRLGIGVLESVPSTMNFPPSDPLYQGSQWNQPVQNVALAEADVVLVLDSDVPWMPTVNRPARERRDLPHRHRPAEAVDAALVHRRARQLPRRRADRAPPDERLSRRPRSTAKRSRRAAATMPAATPALRRRAGSPAPRGGDGTITPEFLTAALAPCDRRGRHRAQRGHHQLRRHLRPHGAQQARHDLRQRRRVARLARRCGDRRQARRAGAHRGGAHRRRLLPVLGALDGALDGAALPHAVPARSSTTTAAGGRRSSRRSPSIPTAMPAGPPTSASSFDPAPDYGGIAAAAGGAFARTVQRPEEVDAAIAEALDAVRVEKRAAVLDVMLPHL